jgi:ParB family chromosome partitioning protein
LATARTNPAVVLRDAAAIYKVDTEAIGLEVKQEFAAKEKAKRASNPAPSAVVKTKKGA